MRYRLHAAALAAIAGVALVPVAAAGQPADAADLPDAVGPSRSARGSGTTGRSPRSSGPVELGDKAFLTEEEAAALERETLERNERLLNRAAETTTASDQVDRRRTGLPASTTTSGWIEGPLPSERGARR